MGIAKYAVIETTDFNASNYDELIKDCFQEVIVDGVSYMSIYAFESHLQKGDFSNIFNSRVDYDKFLISTKWDIIDTSFNWESDEVTITLRGGQSHVFPCKSEWTIQNIYEALNSTL